MTKEEGVCILELDTNHPPEHNEKELPPLQCPKTMDGSSLRMEPSESPQNLPVEGGGSMPDRDCQPHEIDSLYALSRHIRPK